VEELFGLSFTFKGCFRFVRPAPPIDSIAVAAVAVESIVVKEEHDIVVAVEIGVGTVPVVNWILCSMRSRRENLGEVRLFSLASLDSRMKMF